MRQNKETYRLSGNDIDSARYQARKLYNEGTDQLNGVVFGESDAVQGIILGLARGAKGGNGVLLGGPPGAGKTTTAEETIKLVEGVTPQNKAFISAVGDLSPTKLVGSEDTIIRSGNRDGKYFEDILKSQVIPIINEKTWLLILDEINRTNPTALAACYDILQKGYITYKDGNNQSKTRIIHLLVATMNSGRSLDEALISRFSIGSWMGQSKDDELSESGKLLISSKTEKSRSTDKKIKPVITESGLYLIRAAVEQTYIDENSGKIISRAVPAMRNSFKELDSDYAEGRLIEQIVGNCVLLSYFRGHKGVTRTDIADSVEYNMAAKHIGGNISLSDSKESINEVLSRLL